MAHRRGRLVDGLFGPPLERGIAQFADCVNHGLFGRIRFGTIARDVVHDIEQGFHAVTQVGMLVQTGKKKLIFM